MKCTVAFDKRYDRISNVITYETIFNDYRDLDGLPTPFQLTVSQENNAVSKIQINSAAINPGLLSKLFELPSALR